jgi:SfnB family sulfur acquisition oxidoreductase
MAHHIETDAEAIATAQDLAKGFAREAAERDRERRLPGREVEQFSESGLWGITVPREYGGAGVSNVTLAEVVRLISEADPNLGQIPQNHLYMIEALRLDGTESQKRFFFDLALRGIRFGNAFSEIGTKSVSDVQTKLSPSTDGYVLNGRKFYSSGALFAHWIPVVAKDEADHTVIAFVDRNAKGLTVVDDWSSFGQRTTASGTTVLDRVEVRREHVLQHYLAFERPTTMGAVAQIIQAAVDVGIASAAFKDTTSFVRSRTRPWIDSGVEIGSQDPLSVFQVGELAVKLHAAEALLRRAGELLDVAFADLTEGPVAAASIAVAESKAIAADAAVTISSKLFELAGTRSTLNEFNLDRHWRNARTHTLHDPARWKYYGVGNYYLNGVNPPRHPWF